MPPQILEGRSPPHRRPPCQRRLPHRCELRRSLPVLALAPPMTSAATWGGLASPWRQPPFSPCAWSWPSPQADEAKTADERLDGSEEAATRTQQGSHRFCTESHKKTNASHKKSHNTPTQITRDRVLRRCGGIRKATRKPQIYFRTPLNNFTLTSQTSRCCSRCL